MQKKLYIALMIVLVTGVLGACTSGDNRQKLLQGEWNIVLWGDQPREGSLIFKDSTMKFEMAGITEEAVFRLHSDTLTFRRTGGGTNMISSGNDWVIDTLSANTLGLKSHFGLTIKAGKSN